MSEGKSLTRVSPQLQFRGPAVGKAVPTNDDGKAETDSEDPWLSLQRHASVRTNGTFVVLDA